MALRTHLQDTRNLLDPMLAWNWDMFLPRSPGGVGGDIRSLMIKCQTSEIPELVVVSATTELRGSKVKHKSKREFGMTLDTTIIETRDMGTRSLLGDWFKLMHDPINNRGAYKSEYAIDGVEMILYDDKPVPVRRFVYYGVYPEQVGKVQASADPNGIAYPVTWSYDYFDELPL
jgi:hypothetical protein